jgi:hypothetical protein
VLKKKSKKVWAILPPFSGDNSLGKAIFYIVPAILPYFDADIKV